MARRDALLRLHKSLVARAAALREALADELAHLHLKSATSTGDTADAAFDAGNEVVASQLAELEARELSMIERALRRIKQGTYGTCEMCHTKIPVARLNALPYTTACVNCQRELEKDPDWVRGRNDANWENLAELDVRADDQEIDLSGIELDYTNNR